MPAVLWTVAKVLLILLAAVLGLVLFVLLIPVTVGLQSENGAFRVWLRLWFVKFGVFPVPPWLQKLIDRFGGGEKKEKPQKEKKPKTEPVKAAARLSSPLQKLLELLEKIRLIAANAGWFLKRGFWSLRIRHIRVLVPVGGEDVAKVGIQCGRVHAALGAALGVLQNYFRMQFDQLYVEPDFTGQSRQKPVFACEITAHGISIVIAAAVVLVRLVREGFFDGPQRQDALAKKRSI